MGVQEIQLGAGQYPAPSEDQHVGDVGAEHRVCEAARIQRRAHRLALARGPDTRQPLHGRRMSGPGAAERRGVRWVAPWRAGSPPSRASWPQTRGWSRCSGRRRCRPAARSGSCPWPPGRDHRAQRQGGRHSAPAAAPAQQRGHDAAHVQQASGSSSAHPCHAQQQRGLGPTGAFEAALTLDRECFEQDLRSVDGNHLAAQIRMERLQLGGRWWTLELVLQEEFDRQLDAHG